ncbi:hypothetical protein FRACA_440032 [Frankia canadensis]|uniref:Uncharacterized protein n=1 Tax=Frankia canadensis TaxID=1836972 RepID=A0A2I2KXE2_9ACTN|nr:hypothetical protein FRACA_440032 [Frankia canadensis]SOU57625.1 hypothetical protein FRACA_440032 [Frankia canadensis]
MARAARSGRANCPVHPRHPGRRTGQPNRHRRRGRRCAVSPVVAIGHGMALSVGSVAHRDAPVAVAWPLDLVDDRDREVLVRDADLALGVDHGTVGAGAVGAAALALADVARRRGDGDPPHVAGPAVDVERVRLVERVLALGRREVGAVDEPLTVLVLQRATAGDVHDGRGLLADAGQNVDEGPGRVRVHRTVDTTHGDDDGVRVLCQPLDDVPRRDVTLDAVRLAGELLHAGGVDLDRRDLVPPPNRFVSDAASDLTRGTKNDDPRHAIASDSSVVRLMDSPATSWLRRAFTGTMVSNELLPGLTISRCVVAAS